MPQTWTKLGNLGKPHTGGSAPIPASLGLGTPVNVTVPLDTAMPTSNYRCTASISGTATLVGSVVVQGIMSKTTTSVVVRVAMTSLVTVSGTVDVVCVKV